LEGRKMNELEEGKIVEGKIIRIVEEGAFVDIGSSRKAVISRKDLDKFNQNQTEEIQEGESIEVYVTHAPENGGNPLVSAFQALHPDEESTDYVPEGSSVGDPWHEVEAEYQVDDLVEGTVTHIKRYGAFVKLPIGVEGLVHVSEMEPGYTRSPWDIVSEGDRVLVQVLKIEPQRQRIGLSLKQVL
jgi:ribosomal protein S1